MVAGRDAATFGEAKNSWLTGTAAWTFVDVSQFILGIQPTLAGKPQKNGGQAHRTIQDSKDTDIVPDGGR